jgi:hypothetical protein
MQKHVCRCAQGYVTARTLALAYGFKVNLLRTGIFMATKQQALWQPSSRSSPRLDV